MIDHILMYIDTLTFC